MKIVVFFLLLTIFSIKGLSQSRWYTKINDSIYINSLSNSLKIGEKMPDLSFGYIENNTKEKIKFSELRGKLVVLDFWASWCVTCIDEFPKMEELQRKFSDKLQIILVNPYESLAEVKRRLTKFHLPALPSIMKDSLGDSEKFLKIFPLRSLGHKVWIDKSGTIRLRGGAQNMTAEKLDKFLKGENIFILKDNNVVPQFDSQIPYHKLIGELVETPIRFSSLITDFNNEYEAENKGVAEQVIDSVKGTIRNTFINVKLLDLYTRVFKTQLLESKKKILYGPIPRSNKGLFGYHCVIIPKDTTRYTSDFLSSIDNDKLFTKAKVCYEQIVPIGTTVQDQLTFMLSDLNKYFGHIYDTKARIEKLVVPCYILYRTSNIDRLAARSDYGTNISESVRNSKPYTKYENTYMSIFIDIIENNDKLVELFRNNFINGGPFLLINETGFTNLKRIDIEIPAKGQIASMSELRRILAKYDLDIKVDERELDFLIITDNSDLRPK